MLDIVICLTHCILDICLPNMQNLVYVPLLDPFSIYIVYIFYGPSIIHKDDHFAKSELILYEKQESSNFGIRCWPLSVDFISLTVRDRGNSSTYYRKLSAQSIQRKKNDSKLRFICILFCLVKIYLYIVLLPC